MFKKLMIIIMLFHQIKGMALTLPHPAGVTIYNFHITNNHWHYHHHDHTTLKTRVNRLDRRCKALRLRIEKLERQKDRGNILSNIFSYYGLLGMSAMLSSVMVQRATGFIDFPHTTVEEVAVDVGIIALSAYGASLVGVGGNKVIGTITQQKKPSPKVDWLLPTAFGALSFLTSWKPLEKIIITSPPHDIKRMAIGGGLFVATVFLSSALIHFAHHKWYDKRQYRK